jgi:hypothetical protein
MLAMTKILHDPRTAVYLAKQRSNGKTSKEAIRSLKRHPFAASFTYFATPTASQPPSA